MFLFFDPYKGVVTSTSGYPQDVIRNVTSGVNTTITGMVISTDSIYLIGFKAGGNMDVLDSSGNISLSYNAGTQGAIIIKYGKASNNPLAIARIEGGGTDLNYSGHVDGNFIYAHGFVGTSVATITDFAGNNPLNAAPANRAYFIKFNNTTGTAVWRATFGQASLTMPLQSASYNDTFTYCVATRSTTGSLILYNASNDATIAFTTTSTGPRNSVLVQYNSTTGNINWYASFSCTNGISIAHRGVLTTTSGEAIVYGDNNNSTSMTYYESNDTSSTLVSRQSAVYIIKYSTSGTVATISGNPFTLFVDVPSGSPRVYCHDAACSKVDNSIYVVCYFDSTVTASIATNVGGGTGATFGLNARSGIIKWDANGIFQWCSDINGVVGASLEGRVALDNSGNSYVAYVKGTGTSALTDATRTNTILTVPATTANQPVIVKYDPSGTPLWYIYNTGAATSITITSLRVDGDNLFISGYRTGAIIWTSSLGYNVGSVATSTVTSSFYMRFYLAQLP